MAHDVTVYVYGDGQPRDMRRIVLNIDSERRRIAAEALRTDAERVYTLQNVIFELCVVRIRIIGIYPARERDFCQNRRVIERSSDADADHYGRARVRAGVFYRFNDKIYYLFPC